MASKRRPDPEIPDFDISISAKLDSVRFGVVPETRVHWDGTPGYDGETWEKRENLPERPQAGVTYDDATVRWWASGRVGDKNYTEEE
jgi:hypothetical protein